MKRILVTGAGGSASYNYIESLRNNPNKDQFYIVGADISPYHLELAKVDKRYILPKVGDNNYIAKLNEIIKKENIDFLHIQPDTEVYYISKNREKIQANYLLPSHQTIKVCQNKMEMNVKLRQANVKVPEAYFAESEKILKERINMLLKTNEKVWLRAIRGAGSKAALPVKKYIHAKMWIDYWKTMKGLDYQDFMVSEFLPGKEYAFQSFWSDGNLLMSQARERKQYVFGNLTPSGQSSSPSVAMTINNSEVNEIAAAAVRAIDKMANGIFCVDLKTDKNGRVLPIEINAGRFFTTSYFFSAAGLNMPYYYTKQGIGEKINDHFKQYDNLVEGLYWVRMIDMGYKLVRNKKWTSEKI